MPKTDGTPTKGEVTSEQLRQTKSELMNLAQELTLREETVAEKLAAASLAEQLRLLREDKRREGEERGERLPSHRPSTYTDEEAEALCHWIAEGKSLRSWCRETGRQAFTVYSWMRQRPDFAQRYARAHEDRSDSLADEIIEIADDVAGTDSIAAVQAAKLRVDTRKWVAAKLRPQKWGEKQVVEQSGTVTFQLGIAPRQRPVDAEAIEIKDLEACSTDYESVNQPPRTLPAPSIEPGDAPDSSREAP